MILSDKGVVVTMVRKESAAPDLNLQSLALRWLEQPDRFIVKKNQRMEGRSGEEYLLDLVVQPIGSQDLEDQLLVKIADMRKSCGTDQVAKQERASKDLQTKMLLISNKFSAQARHLAHRAELLVMDRDEIENRIVR